MRAIRDLVDSDLGGGRRCLAVIPSREIAEALPSGVGRLEVIARTGHFPWLDAPERYWPVIEGFIAQQHSADF